jgi:hypothetical protein
MSDAYEPRYGEPRKSSGGGAMKWVLGLGCGCLGLVLLCAGGCGVMMYMGTQQMKKTKLWTDVVAKASANNEVTDEMGSPLEAGWMPMGGSSQFQVQNTNGVETGNVDMIIPLEGPKGKGSVHVVGKSTTGQWEYSKMEVTNPSGKKVDLLKGAKSEIKK